MGKKELLYIFVDMVDDDKIARLTALAKEKGICAQGERKLTGMDMGEAARYYAENPEWCLERGYPGLDALRGERELLESVGVYVDRAFDGELLNERAGYIFHNCKGWIRTRLNVEKGVMPCFYLGDGSDLRIVGEGERVKGFRDVVMQTTIKLYGGSEAKVESDGTVEFEIVDN